MISKVTVYSDGGSRGNPGPSAIGVLVCDEKGGSLKEHRETIGETTNNVAEYTAVIVGLELAKTMGAKKVDYFVDSELVARQLTGVYKIKAPHIRTLYDQVQAILPSFEKVTFTHVRREHPKLRIVDALVNQVLDEEGF